jgi:hypothetical protein
MCVYKLTASVSSASMRVRENLECWQFTQNVTIIVVIYYQYHQIILHHLTFRGHRQCRHDLCPDLWPFPYRLAASVRQLGRHGSAWKHTLTSTSKILKKIYARAQSSCSPYRNDSHGRTSHAPSLYIEWDKHTNFDLVYINLAQPPPPPHTHTHTHQIFSPYL